MSKTAAGAYFQRLHALDAALGTELLGGPQTIQASFAGTGAGSSGGVVNFDPKQYEERAGLLDAERPDHHGVDVALRHRSLHRLDHRL